ASYIRFASDRSAALPGGTTGDARVEFVAGAQGIDLVGGVAFDRGIASIGLRSAGDLRLTGVNDRGLGQIAYSGQLLTAGDLLI
ncbi:hypothetical protein, partial [Escherichia coli]